MKLFTALEVLSDADSPAQFVALEKCLAGRLIPEALDARALAVPKIRCRHSDPSVEFTWSCPTRRLLEAKIRIAEARVGNEEWAHAYIDVDHQILVDWPNTREEALPGFKS